MILPLHPASSTSAELAHTAGTALERLRSKAPLVQNITNLVAMDVSANVLLAVGASPAMVHAQEEVEEFLGFSDALIVNIGTISTPFATSMRLAAAKANVLKKPWVLDPVGAGATHFRRDLLAALIGLNPSIIRGNASEILGVANIAGVSETAALPRGVDSRHTTSAAETAAIQLALLTRGTVAATGAVDFVTDGTRMHRLGNGHPMMARVTALGCALSALCGAFACVEDDYFLATASALAVYGVAGEIAGRSSQGPGSFRVAFIDCLHRIATPDLERHLWVLP